MMNKQKYSHWWSKFQFSLQILLYTIHTNVHTHTCTHVSNVPLIWHGGGICPVWRSAPLSSISTGAYVSQLQCCSVSCLATLPCFIFTQNCELFCYFHSFRQKLAVFFPFIAVDFSVLRRFLSVSTQQKEMLCKLSNCIILTENPFKFHASTQTLSCRRCWLATLFIH